MEGSENEEGFVAGGLENEGGFVAGGFAGGFAPSSGGSDFFLLDPVVQDGLLFASFLLW